MKKNLLPLLPLLAIIAFCNPLYAQTFTEITANFNSIDVGLNSRPTFTDLDGDGLLDMLIGEENGNINHYEQDALNSTAFTLVTAHFNSLDVGAAASPTFTDLDGDGLLDMLVGSLSGIITHYEQNASNSTSFTLRSSSFNSINVGLYSAPTFTDLDGDGLLDMLIGEEDGTINHYEQNSANSTSFTLVTDSFNSIDVSSKSAPTFADIDGDGLLDLLIGNHNGVIYQYEQNSTNSTSFTLITMSIGGIDVGLESSPALTDLDGDGKLDLLIGEQDGNINHWEAVAATINSSCVTTTVPASVESASALLGGNITDDNSHLVTRRGVCFSSMNTTPTLADTQEPNGSSDGSFSETISGLLEATTYYIRAFSSSSLGTYYGAVESFTTTTYDTVSSNFNSIDIGGYSAPAFTDIDGDGLLDLLIGKQSGFISQYEQNSVNSTSFTLVTTGFNSIDVGNWSSPTIADLDGDGLLDLLIGEEDGNINHYEQDAFSSTSFSLITDTFNTIDVGTWSAPTFTDLDGDGLLDMLIGSENGTVHHYEQDAANTTSFTLVTSTFNSIDVGGHAVPAITDIDGDYLLDLLIGEYDGEIHHYEQNSANSASFTLVTVSFNSIDVGHEAKPTFTDLDGDGRLDLLIGAYAGNINHWQAASTSVNSSCTSTDIPSSVTAGSALLGGNITDDNAHLITRRGVCYSGINTTPTLADLHEPNGSAKGIFSEPIFGLFMGTTYYVRAFSSSSLGTFYGPVQSFTTSGGFTEITATFNAIDVGSNSSPVVIDLDSDGLLDLIIGEFDGNLNHYEQNAINSTSFILLSSSFNSIDVGWWSSPCFTDIDADGLLDMVVGEITGNLHLYEQNFLNSTAFTIVTQNFLSIDVGRGSTPTFTDIDGDGLLDLIIGEENGHSDLYYEQDSANSYNFSIKTALTAGLRYPSFTDINGDDLLDLLDWSFEGIEHNRQNSPNSTTFTQVSNRFNDIDVGFIPEPTFTDLDGDGKLDLLIGEKDGNINYWESDSLTINPSGVSTAAAIAVNDTSAIFGGNITDDNLHLIVRRGVCYSTTNTTPTLDDTQVSMGCGLGTFSDTIRGLSPDSVYFIRAFSSSSLGTFYGELKSFSFIHFDLVTQNFNSIDLNGFSSMAFADFDGNGLLDMLVGEMFGKLNHYEQAAANSTSFALVTSNFNSIDVGDNPKPVLTDLDGDGLLDLIIGNYAGSLVHYEQLTEHSTTFTEVTSNFNSIYVGLYSAPTFTDLDGDGLLDLLVGEWEGNINHFEQNSVNSTSFTQVTSIFNSIDVGFESTPTITDLDADGLLDLLIGEYDGEIYHFEQNSVNSISFTLVTSTFNSIDVGRSSVPTLTDLDGDGRLDMLIGEYYGNINHWESATYTATENISYLRTAEAVQITETSADFGGSVMDDNTHLVTRRGVCYSSTNISPALSDTQETMGSGVGAFSEIVSGLTAETNYYVRAFSSSSLGTFYGEVKSLTWPDNMPGTKLEFDGIDDYVQISMDCPETNYTYELYFRTTDQNAKISSVRHPTLGSANDRNLYLESGNIFHRLWDTETIGSGGQNYADGIWHHVAVVVESGVGQRIYVDGEQIASGTKDGSDFDWDSSLDIGYNEGYFEGSIDEVRLWNVVRTESEIREGMHLLLNGYESGLISYWQFNDGNGSILLDVIRGNDGELQNMTENDWMNSTAPLPFESAASGNWETNSTWLPAQNAPARAWSRVKVKHNITLNNNMELIEMTVDTNAIFTVSTGDTLTITK